MEQRPWRGPLFIVGLPRSGTKLLRTILNNHPKIQIPTIETGFLPLWISEWEHYGDLSDYSIFQRFYNRSIWLPYFQYQRERGELIDPQNWYESCEDYSVNGVFEALIRHDSGTLRKADTIWGDKSPSYVRYLGLIARTIPNARFVHIIRDVRDYCLSAEKAWGKNKMRAAQRWVDSIQSARLDAVTIQSQYLEVQYENLLLYPSDTTSQVCDFIGVTFCESMLNLHYSSENIGDTKGQSNIVANNKEKYLTMMSYNDLYSIESVARNLLVDMGYSVKTSAPEGRVSPRMMKAYQILDGVNSLIFRIKHNGLLAALRQWSSGVLLIARMREVKRGNKKN